MQQDLSSFFEEYLTKDSIFRDRSVLESSHAPDELPHRNEQTHMLAQILAPCLKMEKPSNIFLFGKTGTGKTAAFAIPLLEKIRPGQGFFALIVVPTRELAMQVKKETESFAAGSRLKIVAVFGGESVSKQAQLLRMRPEIVEFQEWKALPAKDCQTS